MLLNRAASFEESSAESSLAAMNTLRRSSLSRARLEKAPSSARTRRPMEFPAPDVHLLSLSRVEIELATLIALQRTFGGV